MYNGDMEDARKKYIGRVYDYAIYPDGRRELLLDMSFNVVVDDFSTLIACLVKNAAGYKGAAYWAVGSGGVGWDDNNPPPALETDKKLASETYRKAILPEEIVFLDASDNVTATPTNKIGINVTFNENEANGSLREFGITGGNATSALNTGIFINHKTHKLIPKTSAFKLERHCIFTF